MVLEVVVSAEAQEGKEDGDWSRINEVPWSRNNQGLNNQWYWKSSYLWGQKDGEEV